MAPSTAISSRGELLSRVRQPSRSARYEGDLGVLAPRARADRHHAESGILTISRKVKPRRWWINGGFAEVARPG